MKYVFQGSYDMVYEFHAASFQEAKNLVYDYVRSLIASGADLLLFTLDEYNDAGEETRHWIGYPNLCFWIDYKEDASLFE